MPWTTEQKIFIVEAYFRQKSIHWFSDEAYFLLSGHVNSKNNIFWGSTPPEHCLQRPLHSMWSVLPGLPSPNMASLHHSGSRTTTSGLWQSTSSDMSRCLASSGQHLVDGEGSSGSSSGSSRMVPTPTPETNLAMATAAFPWPTDQPHMWPAVVAAFTGLELPRFLYVGYLKDRVYGNNPQTIPDLKVAITAAIRAIPREEWGRFIENFARRI